MTTPIDALRGLRDAAKTVWESDNIDWSDDERLAEDLWRAIEAAEAQLQAQEECDCVVAYYSDHTPGIHEFRESMWQGKAPETVLVVMLDHCPKCGKRIAEEAKGEG